MDLEDVLIDYLDNLTVKETSFLGLRPGDLVVFNYEGSSRIGLVVKSKRTSTGYFLSGRNNTLLNVFLLQSISPDMFNLMINTLYRNRIRCTYTNSPKILGAFLGKHNFRTFNVSKIEDLMTILIR